MIDTLTRRELLTALAASLGAPWAFAETPNPPPPPPGTARYLVEVLAFRLPGAAPKAYPVPAVTAAQTLPGRTERVGADQYQLTAAKDALARKGHCKILTHLAWAALVPPNGRTTAHLEDLGDDDTAPITGTVAVQRSQTLFLGLELDYAAGGQSYGLREKRRIKFGERHYFDHPAFGVLVAVTPSKGAAATD